MKILIAEDDSNLLFGLDALLKREGYQCVLAKDGVEAQTHLTEFEPDLCLFDIAMPRLDGLQLCQSVRTRYPTLPIILLTAKDKDSDHIKGLDTGADDYITKPFRPELLLARVRALMRRAGQQPDASTKVITLGPLRLDTKTLKLFYQDIEIDLTVKECQIMSLFLQNPNAVLSRDQIFNQCWHKNFVPNSRTLDQTILVLRHKLEHDLRLPRIIKSIYGVGYQLDLQEK